MTKRFPTYQVQTYNLIVTLRILQLMVITDILFPTGRIQYQNPGNIYKITISGNGSSIYGSNFNKSTVLATVIFQGEKLTPALKDDVTITEVYNGTGTYTLDASNIVFKKTSGEVVSDVTASGTVTL